MRIEGNLQQASVANATKIENVSVQKRENTENVKSIQASDLNLMQESIQERRQKAIKEAMGIVGDQFKADGKIDKNLEERANRISENQEKANRALKEKNLLKEEQESLKDTYAISEDSQEQKDLELRLKLEEAMKPDSEVVLTEEEWKRAQELGPMTEYQQRYMELESSKSIWQKEIDDAQKVIAEETYNIRAIKLELLKHHGMIDAQKAAEESLKAVGNEIIGMTIQEGLEHVQEEIEEPDTKQMQGEIDQQIQEILEKQKLLQEDLKGMQVDDII